MTEVPEHLRKRAEEARAKAAAAKAAADAPAEAPAEELSAEQQEAASKIPAHLLERSKAGPRPPAAMPAVPPPEPPSPRLPPLPPLRRRRVLRCRPGPAGTPSACSPS